MLTYIHYNYIIINYWVYKTKFPPWGPCPIRRATQSRSSPWWAPARTLLAIPPGMGRWDNETSLSSISGDFAPPAHCFWHPYRLSTSPSYMTTFYFSLHYLTHTHTHTHTHTRARARATPYETSLSRKVGLVGGNAKKKRTESCSSSRCSVGKGVKSSVQVGQNPHTHARNSICNPYLHERVNARHSLGVLHFWQRFLPWPSKSIGRANEYWVCNFGFGACIEPWRSETFAIHLSIAAVFFSAWSMAPITSSCQHQHQNLFIWCFECNINRGTFAPRCIPPV